MCTFLIFDISSLQLIPVNIIAHPYTVWQSAAIVGPAIVATAVKTLGVAVVYRKLKNRKGKKKLMFNIG